MSVHKLNIGILFFTLGLIKQGCFIDGTDMLKALLIRIGISTVLFMSICLMIIYYFHRNQLENEIKEMDLIQRERLISEYSYSKKRYNDILDTLESVFAESIVDLQVNEIEDIRSTLLKLSETYGLIEVFIANLDGELITSSGYAIDVLNTKPSWFIEIVNGKDLYQGEYHKSLNGSMAVTFSAPIKINDKLIGVAGINIPGTGFLSSHLIHALTINNGKVFSTDNLFAKFLGKKIYDQRPVYLKASQDPLIYANPDNEIFSVSKIVLDDGNLLFSVLPLDKPMEKNQTYLFEIFAINFIFTIVIMIVIFVALRKELKIISRISDLVKNIGRGQLIDKPINAKYEFGLISTVINELVKKLAIVISKSQTIMTDIKTKQTLAVELVEKNRTNSLNELSFVEKVKIASSDLAATATNVANNAANAEQATIDANVVINSSQSILANATEASEQINTSFFEAKDTVNQLREHSEKISTVVDVIKNISEQTNLLALNAAIEAARAGAQGRGFAVVADEVRALAAKTQKSTIDIHNIISQLQDKSKQANDSMNQNVGLMKLTQNSMSELKHSFEVISKKVSGISQINAIVAAASEEQNVVTQDISKQVENMNLLVQQNLEGVEKSSFSNQKVSDLAELLQSELSFFKVK